jgi:hypothetical protein
MKKSRLLEIIREEISTVLRESETIDLPGDASRFSSKQKEAAIKIARTTSKDMTLGTPKNPVEFVEGEQLNEDLLMEGPFIEGPLDFAYIDGKLEKRVLGKAVEAAAMALEKSFPNIDPESATKIITSKKSRTSESTPGPVKAALEQVDDAIQAQLDTFEDTALLKDLVNRGEIGKNDEKALERITSYIEPDEEGNIKRYVEKIGGPQTLNAVEKILSGDTPVSLASKTATEPAKKEPKAEPKATTKAPEAPKATAPAPKAEPKAKESDEEKATKAASASKGVSKKADRKDELLKDKKAAEDKMRGLAKLIGSATGEERAALMKDLKQANADKLEIDKKIEDLF